jgi:hypothetical protein
MRGNHQIDRRALLREWAPVFAERLELAPELPSGLRWKNPNRARLIAGSRLCDGYWKIDLHKGGDRFVGPVGQVILVMNGIYPEADTPEVDHIDRNKDNNCVTNLRWVSSRGNNRNRGIFKPGKPRYVRQTSAGTWVADYRIVVPGEYTTAEQAYCAALAHKLERDWPI